MNCSAHSRPVRKNETNKIAIPSDYLSSRMKEWACWANGKSSLASVIILRVGRRKIVRVTLECLETEG